MTMLGLDVTRAEDVFRNVVALYSTLVEGRSQLKVRRVELNMNNEVTAEPLDFICDVEFKAKRVLTPRQYALFQYYSVASAPQLIPADIQLTLGKAWYASDLNLDGAYKSLYFRIKNAQARESLRARMEDATGIESEQFD